MISTFTKNETVHLIAGPAGKLEVVTTLPSVDARGAWGIVCHPHPLFGGTMHNKVVTTLVKTFQGLGLNAVRFNFRGAGKSEGQFDNGRGELADLLAVIAWVQQSQKLSEIWLAGFSFGAYVAAQAASEYVAQRLVTVAPPVENFPMQDLPPITCPWVLVQGERDEVVQAKAVLDWAENRHPRPTIIRFPEAGHFFHGQLTELRTRIEEALIRYG
jgi:hypothetical protein